MMLIPNAMTGTTYGVNGEFAIVGRNRNQFASRKFFGSPALVGIDVSGLGADHRVIGVGQGFETEAVGGGAIEYYENVNVGAEMLLKFASCGLRITVIPISNSMTLVGGEDSFYHVRM